MELNRERIKRGLECCKGSYDCFTCDIYKRGCAGFREGLARDALALIKELTEEYDSMAKSVNEASDLIRKLKRDKEMLELQIEVKERICDSYMLQYGTVADKEVWLKKERANTVRKYREQLYRAFAHFDSKDKSNKKAFLEAVDQIAKEMV